MFSGRAWTGGGHLIRLDPDNDEPTSYSHRRLIAGGAGSFWGGGVKCEDESSIRAEASRHDRGMQAEGADFLLARMRVAARLRSI